MTAVGTIELILDELLLAVRPIGSILGSPDGIREFLEQRGFAFASTSLGPVVTALGPTRTTLVDLIEEGVGLAIDVAEGTADASEYVEFGERLFGVVSSLRDLPDQLATLGRTLPATFPVEVFDVLLAGYLVSAHPVVYRIFVLLGLIEQRTIEPASGDPLARDLPYVHIAMRYDRIATMFREPGQLATDVYGWNTPEFNSDLFLLRIQRLYTAMQRVAKLGDMTDEAVARMFPAAVGRADPPNELKVPIYDDSGAAGALEAGVVLMPVGGTAGPADGGLALMPYAEGTLSAEIDITDTLSLTLGGQASFEGGFAFLVRPSGFVFEAGIFATLPAPEIRVELARKPPPDQTSMVLLGSPAPGSRLECDRVLLAVGGNLQDFYIVGGVLALRAVVAPSSDGLLGTLLPNGILVEAGDILLGWRPSRGVYFEDGASLRVVIPINKTLGPIRIAEIEARLAFDPDIMVGIGVSADLTIGPLFMSAKGLGLAVKMTPKPRGKFGGFDLEPGLLLPSGYAANVKGGPISGGGALFVEENGYKGALALRFASFGISAFAILTTRMPSGEQGFSFLATIFAEFEIQLGFGFKLTGLGGIIGIHRTTDVEALRAVLKAGNLDGFLFPPNPIQDATRILRDMGTVFPVQEGTYVFGPMARIAWATPTLIEVKLGLILELGPAVRILILGQIRVVLPTKDSPVLLLSMDFLGVIDFGAKTISLDATLANSRLLEWPVSGEIALRTGWGPNADFVFSIGGFHPQFPAPANFPSLQRLTINFGTDNPRITLTAYTAITLNTFQMGARLELYFRGPDIWLVGKFDVDGLAYFDALIHFNPFEFDVALGLALTLLRNGNVLCSIGGDIRLTGPNRYHIKGKAWAEVLGCKVTVPVDKTFGDAQRDELQTVDVLAMFVAAVAEPDHWEPVLPAAHVTGVALAAPTGGTSGTILLDAVSGVRFTQRLIPLGVDIDKLGTARLANEYRRFGLRAVDASGATLAASDARSPFPTGQFFDLTEDEQFRVPATEAYRSGLEIAPADNLQYPAAGGVSMSYEYETLSMLGDDEDDEPISLRDSFVVPVANARAWSRASLEAIGRPRTFGYTRPAQRLPVVVEPERFVVVDGRATAAGAVAALAEDGAPLFGTYGELRTSVGDRALVSSFLADPASIP